MVILTKILFGLNKKLYNWPSHLVIVSFWIYSLVTQANTSLNNWFKVGLLIWALLIVYRSLKEGPPPLPKTKKEYLGYLVGLNIAVVLGPVSVPLFLFLAFLEKQEPKK